MSASTPTVRPAAVAGFFYPGAREALVRDLDTLLTAARGTAPAHPPPKALIVPHAGYVYSGAVAASAYVLLAAERIRRVVLMGPAHRVAVRGLALPVCSHMATPLGLVEIDQDAIATLAGMPQVGASAQVHAQEHSLEVHLPFLQTVLHDFRVVPFAVGMVRPQVVADVLERLWGGPETLIVISSDLSHFLTYGEAQSVDRATVDTILRLSPDLNHHQACGATPVAGLALAAHRHGLTPRLLDLRNSGDTAGDKQRVVGYASIAFYEGTDHVT